MRHGPLTRIAQWPDRSPLSLCSPTLFKRGKSSNFRATFWGRQPPMGETERLSLEEDGVLGQFRLSCQIRVHSDLELEVLMRASQEGWEPGIELEP